jgi:Flp pilus assembly protein TadD
METETLVQDESAPRKRRLIQPVVLGGALVVILTQVIYLGTLTLTCPFWDSGEFIATSYILGIPHPPGTPLYVLIGRLFTLIPIGMVATRVNYLSAFGSTLAALFTYLVAIRFFRRWFGPAGDPEGDRVREEPWLGWLAVAVGLVAAFFTAFGRTFWENAVEAEVYALSCFVMVFTVWLTLKWAEGVERFHQIVARRIRDTRQRLTLLREATRPEMLLLIIYLLFLSIGIHMGTFIVLPAIVLFVLLVDPATVLNRNFILALFVAVLSIMLFFIMMRRGAGLPTALLVSLAAYGVVTALFWKDLGRQNYVFWFYVLGFLGVTVHLYLIIRANLDPAINEADPSTWAALWKVLIRDQYKPPNPFFERQASFAVQFSEHFLRYAKDQYNLGILPGWLKFYVPYALGFLGLIGQWLRDRKGAFFMTVLYLTMSIFLIWYLNFKEDEVRDRDYFFVGSFQFFAIWIGLGIGELALSLREVLAKKVWRYVGPAVAALGVVLSVLPAKAMYYEHDRTNFWVARDYAYNMLYPLEPNAIIFTNGDNDTFPVWYIQEVEGIRKDVRVVNLSLLQTGWYIKQLRDYEPKVDLGWTDEEIDMLRPYRDPSGKVVWVNDICVQRIVDLYYGKRPIYVAVTVPDQRGLERRLVMEGLVFALREEGEPDRIDVEKTYHNLTEVYQYRGLLDENGYYDTTVYKDENASKLVQNYSAAWVRIAHQAIKDGNRDLAMEALERARRISPSFPGVAYTLGYLQYRNGDLAAAESTFSALVEQEADDPQVWRLLGMVQEAQGKTLEALRSYEQSVVRGPEDRDAYINLFQFLIDLGRPLDALEVLDQWIRRHPEDRAFQAARQSLLESLDSLGVERKDRK